MEKARE